MFHHKSDLFFTIFLELSFCTQCYVTNLTCFFMRIFRILILHYLVADQELVILSLCECFFMRKECRRRSIQAQESSEHQVLADTTRNRGVDNNQQPASSEVAIVRAIEIHHQHHHHHHSHDLDLRQRSRAQGCVPTDTWGTRKCRRKRNL